MTNLKSLVRGAAAALLGAATLAGLAAGTASAEDKKFKIYLAMSYSGNAWQSEAANIVKALAQTAPYEI